jgi:hypothetical protein
MAKRRTTAEGIRRLYMEHRRYKAALKEIAGVGDGIKEDMRDYKNITRNVKWRAATALKPEACPTCGQVKKPALT